VGTLLLASRKVELDEDQIVASIIFKLGLRKDLFIEFDTPTAPVRTCKIEQNKFVIRLRLFLRFLVIVQPVRLGPGKLPTKENRSRYCEDNQTIRFHVTIFDVITAQRKSGTAHRRCGDHFFAKPRNSPAQQRRAIDEQPKSNADVSRRVSSSRTCSLGSCH